LNEALISTGNGLTDFILQGKSSGLAGAKGRKVTACLVKKKGSSIV